jgi:hypothetical protein
VHRFVFRGTPALLTVSLCLGIIGETRTALADPVTSLFFQMQGTVCAPNCGQPLNVTFNPSTTNGPTSDQQVLLGGANNNASVSGVADFGHLGVLAEVDTQAMTGGLGNLSALTSASFTEPLMVTSPTLAPGTIVKAMAVVGMDGIAEVSGGALSPDPGGAVTSAQWSFFASMQDLNNPINSLSVCLDSLVQCDPTDPSSLLGPNVPFEVTKPFVFTFVVGETPVIVGQLLVVASAAASAFEDGAFASESVTSFAFHTANFYLQPLDDFTLVSASGHDYSLPVSTAPEPNSVLLVAGALSALLIVRRRGSRR